MPDESPGRDAEQSSPSSPILELLAPEAVTLQQRYADSTEVITDLVERLVEVGSVDYSYLQAVLEREAAMPTGLELNGGTHVAIPHADAGHVKRAGLALATLTHPVTFQAMGDRDRSLDVRIVMLMALQDPNAQVKMLMEIARLFQHPEAVSALLDADKPEMVAAAIAMAGENQNDTGRGDDSTRK